MKEPRVSIQLLGLSALVLIIFYPVVQAPLSPLDDRAIVQLLYSMDEVKLKSFFTSASDYYFRPVLWATYLLDMKFWGAETSFMHLENILVHLTNTLLIFSSACILRRLLKIQQCWFPALAAVLFAIHPVNTEAVNWIAGRSDLLAGFFVLLANLLLLMSLEYQRPAYAWLSLVLLAPGFFAKETAVFYLPAAMALVYCLMPLPGSRRIALSVALRQQLPYQCPFIVGPLVYLLVRSGLFLSRDTGFQLLKKALDEQGQKLYAMLESAIAGTGFYARKLIWPWPLNFTIDQVAGGYVWVGLLVCTLLLCALWRRGPVAGLLLASMAIGTSAILALLLRPGWTPVAERYMYVPSVFFCLAAALVVTTLIACVPAQKPVLLLLFALLAAISYTTIERNFLWQNNISLFEDSVRKSPDFPFGRSVLADLLKQAGRNEEGNAMIRSNTAPETLRNADFLDLKRALLLFEEGQLVDARSLVLEKRRKGGQLYLKFQELLARVDVALISISPQDDAQFVFDEAVTVHKELYQRSHDPFFMYQLGQLYLRAELKSQAANCFATAAREAPIGAHYKAAAETLARKLEDL